MEFSDIMPSAEAEAEEYYADCTLVEDCRDLD